MGFLSRIFGENPASAQPRHGGEDMVALVALMPSWEARSVEDVRQDLDSLFPGEFVPAREQGNFVVEGPVADASYLVQCTVPQHAGLFLIHNVPGPYSAFSDFLAHVEDPQLKKIAERQSCWMSVDLMHRHTTDEDGYRFVSTVLAKFAPVDAALLVHPGRYLVTHFSPELRRVLASGGSPFGLG